MGGWRAWSTVAAVQLFGCVSSTQVRAQEPPEQPPLFTFKQVPRLFIRLKFTLGPGTQVCPSYSEARLHEEVFRRIGYDPFVKVDEEPLDPQMQLRRQVINFDTPWEQQGSTPAGELSVQIAGMNGEMSATLNYVDEAGHAVWEKPKIETWPGISSESCKGVLRNSGVVFQWEFPHPELRRAPPVTCPAAAPCPDAHSVDVRYDDSRFALWPNKWPLSPLEKPKPDPPAQPERWPFALRLGATVSPELIAAGWASLGLAIDAGVRRGPVSLSVEAHGDPPLGKQSFQNAGAVSFARVSGALLLCGSWGSSPGAVSRTLDASSSPTMPRRYPRRPSTALLASAGTWSFPVAPRGVSSASALTCACQSSLRATRATAPASSSPRRQALASASVGSSSCPVKCSAPPVACIAVARIAPGRQRPGVDDARAARLGARTDRSSGRGRRRR